MPEWRATAERLAQRLWYGGSPWALPLLPLSWLYCGAVRVRARLQGRGRRAAERLPVPVIVVGNITLGGTGKTPLVRWLAGVLRDAGHRPGIVTRGYGGEARHWPQQVRPDADPRAVGDEAVLLARTTGCPLVAGADRRQASEALLAHHDCDLLLSDDGLQHYRLHRDLEILVIDGIRRYGNGFCLPAGPLREPLERLARAEIRVCNGAPGPGEFGFELTATGLRNLRHPDRTLPLTALRGRRVTAVAGIGHPRRFFDQLAALGAQVDPHPFPDHHPFRPADLAFASGDGLLVMTAKDAVKCERFADEDWWYLDVQVRPDPRLAPRLLELLAERTATRRAAASSTAGGSAIM